MRLLEASHEGGSISEPSVLNSHLPVVPVLDEFAMSTIAGVYDPDRL